MADQAREQERAVGITAFVSPNVSGFQCTIKHRYTDFLVNEILPDGTVQHLLTDNAEKKVQSQNILEKNGDYSGESRIGAKRKEPNDENAPYGSADQSKRQRIDDSPADDGRTASVNDESTHDVPEAQQKQQIIATISDSDRTALIGIFGEETTDKILYLYTNVIIHPHRKPREQPSVNSEVITEKSKRTEAHIAVRKIFASKLSTETIQDSPGVIAIRATPTKGPSGARGHGEGTMHKGKIGWDELGGEYLHFTLYKENKDTMEVLFFLASQLKIPVKNFQFAGTKDRRGVTVQRVAVKRIFADRLANLNRMARGWRLGDFEYKNHGLALAELNGNEFHLTLRDCHFDAEDELAFEDKYTLATKILENATTSFREHGFINYYGLQRFGTYTTGSHDTGRFMLKGDLKGAIDSILTYSEKLLSKNVDTSGTTKVPQDDIKRADAIDAWEKSDRKSAEAARSLPRRFQAEGAIMQFLSKSRRQQSKKKRDEIEEERDDWQGALMLIPRNLMLIYPHAYQSYVWNKAAGRRWELYGNSVVQGDLVIVDKDRAGTSKDEVDDQGEPIFHPAAEDSAPSTDDAFVRARPLSKEEAESGKWSIFDIVLPQPGFDVVYPTNEIGKFYEDFMASEEGGELDPHKMRRSWKDVSLSGSYRKFLARPGEGLEYQVKAYVHPEEQLVETDLERLKREKDGGDGSGVGDSGHGQVVGNGEVANGNTDPDHRKIAVVLKMKLGVSQYATTALRELTKAGAFNYKPDYSAR